LLVVLVAGAVAAAMWRRRAGRRTADDYLHMARRAFGAMEGRRTVRCCREVIRLEPRNAEAYYLLGMSAVCMENLDDAIPAFERAVEYRPGYIAAEYALAVGYQQKGDLKGAQQHFQRVLDLQPTNIDARKKLSGLLGLRPEAGISREAPSAHQSLDTIPEGVRPQGQRLLKLYARRKLLKEYFVLALICGVIFQFLIVNDMKKGLPPQQPLWSSIDSVERGFLLILPAAVFVILIGVFIIRVQIYFGISALATLGYRSRRADRMVRLALRRREGEEYEREMQAAKELSEEGWEEGPWWTIELSGAHLVWWLSLALMVTLGGAELDVGSTLWRSVEPVVISGGVLKLAFWYVYGRLSSYPRKRAFLRFYRWWGRGFAPVLLALAPGVYVLLGTLYGW